MIDILTPRNGAILNHNHGIESEDGMLTTVTGTCDEMGDLTVNGFPASRLGSLFTAQVKLTKHVNTLTAQVEGNNGTSTKQVRVIWDKQSFKRFNCFIDDHSFFLTEIARQRPVHLFDHFYPAFWKKMHEKYNIKVTLNCFFRNDHDPDKFEMKDFPDIYKSEFKDNSDWLKLSFHAYSEFPDRPYQNTSPDVIAKDYELVKSEIIRFAGENTFKAPNVSHWAMARKGSVLELAKRGTKALDGQFINANTGLADTLDAASYCDIGYFVPEDESLYLNNAKLWHDFSTGITYMQNIGTINLMPLDTIVKTIHKTLDNPNAAEALNIISHEQYMFKSYFNYLPDIQERIDLSFRTLTENGYTSVFFNDGFLGNPVVAD